MCGIAGAIGWIDPGIKDAVVRMNAALQHRGPDDCGVWQSTELGHGAVLAFRRLAILDLGAGGHQPMIDGETGHAMVFNGEIYNFKELRSILKNAGWAIHSTGDAEVLLKAYGHWGIHAVERLRGMFAFAIWDDADQRAILARDRLGIKPLYYARVNGRGERSVFLFASEIRALIASGLIECRLNSSAISCYVWNGFVPGPETILEGVRLLGAGHLLEVDAFGNADESEPYWGLPWEASQQESLDSLEDELCTAVNQHMVSDVPVGVFLSGGIDSSAIAALAVRGAGRDVRTFNLRFEEAEFDESIYARRVAAGLGTRHTEVILSRDGFRSQLDSALSGLDQPTFDGINTFYVSQAVRNAGMTVALAGTGGDELFGGYRSFADNRRAAQFSRALSRLPHTALERLASWWTARANTSNADVAAQTRWGKVGDVIMTAGQPLHVHQVSYSLFTDDFMQQLLPNGIHPLTCAGLPAERAVELGSHLNGRLDWHAISMLELSLFIGDRLLRDTDCASMWNSLEVRVPLLDHRVVEAASALRTRDRFVPLGRKQALRAIALRSIDSKLFDRPKTGFVLPISSWLRDCVKQQVEETLTDRSLCESVGLQCEAVGRLWRAFQSGSPGIYWSRVWAIFVLLDWCRRHGATLANREGPAEVKR